VAPGADLLYYADGRWYGWHKDRPEYQAFRGERATVEGSEGYGEDPEAFKLHIAPLVALSRDARSLAHGGNGGYQAINLAYLAGAARIVLLGYDMKHRDGRQNWHAEHKVKVPERRIKSWLPAYRSLALELAGAGVEVFNASEETALEAFPRRPIAELLS
jgi:hypothetical protein